MPIQTGQCPSCHAVNSFTAIICLDCKSRLPWGDSVEELQKKLDQAASAAQSALVTPQSQTQLLPQKNTPNSPQRVNTSLTPAAPISGTQILPPGNVMPVNLYEIYLGSFIGKFSAGFFDLDRRSAMFVGFFCAFLYSICIMVGAYLIRQQVVGLFQGFFGGLSALVAPVSANATKPTTVWGSVTFNGVVKLLVSAFTPFLSIAISSALSHKLFSDEESDFGSNIFIAGVSLVPIGLLFLITGLVGIGNWEVTAVLSVAALSYFILMLYNGCTIIGRVRDTAAAVSVPIMLLLSAWFTKIVLTKLFGM